MPTRSKPYRAANNGLPEPTAARYRSWWLRTKLQSLGLEPRALPGHRWPRRDDVVVRGRPVTFLRKSTTPLQPSSACPKRVEDGDGMG
jgi:hypothetical protein